MSDHHDAGSLAFHVRDLIAAAGYHYNPDRPLREQVRECDELIRTHRRQLDSAIEEIVEIQDVTKAEHQRLTDLVAELRKQVESMGRSLDVIGRLRKAAAVGDVVQVLADALLIIGDACETYNGDPTCRSEGSGRTRGAPFVDEMWCQPCVARDALERAGVPNGK